eukprot:1179315-Prorocentrum_minimum.AAC.4
MAALKAHHDSFVDEQQQRAIENSKEWKNIVKNQKHVIKERPTTTCCRNAADIAQVTATSWCFSSPLPPLFTMACVARWCFLSIPYGTGTRGQGRSLHKTCPSLQHVTSMAGKTVPPQSWLDHGFRNASARRPRQTQWTLSLARYVVCGLRRTLEARSVVYVFLWGEKWEKVGNWTQGEKRGRVSGVLSASLPLLAQEDP